jgi:hypothetical protein
MVRSFTFSPAIFTKPSARITSASAANTLVEYIHSRLAALDFILGKLDYTFFETEQEKVRYFTEPLGIDKKYLPAKRHAGAIREQFTDRYFVDKFPMFLLAKASPPVVSFSFVDPGLESLDSFHTHLQAYFPLFCQLSSIRFHYVATRDTYQEGAKQAFLRLFDRHWNPDSPGGLVDYFCLQKKEDLGKLHELSKSDLVALQERKAKFNRREIANLYLRWRAEQVHFHQVRKEYESLRRPETVVFIFTPVNGQVALFEGHPNSLVKTPWKSARKEPFAGDFTVSVTEPGP